MEIENEQLEEVFDEENHTLYLEGEFGITEFNQMIFFLMLKLADRWRSANSD